MYVHIEDPSHLTEAEKNLFNEQIFGNYEYNNDRDRDADIQHYFNKAFELGWGITCNSERFSFVDLKDIDYEVDDVLEERIHNQILASI